MPERYRPCFLLGRWSGLEYPAQVESLARSLPSVLDIHYLRAEYTGPESVDAGMNIVVRRGTPVAEAVRMAEEVRGRLHSGAASSQCVVRVEVAETKRLRGYRSQPSS